MTLRAGVIGRPIRHSLSPLIHTAWIEALGLDARYEAIEGPAEGFADVVGELRRAGLRGLNVTLPYKEAALALADRADPAAAAAGAANVLVFEGGEVLADNTDGLGLLHAFARQAPDCDLAAGPVVVLGAGGAARGAVATLLAQGAQVRIVNRTAPRAEALAQEVTAVLGLPARRAAVYPLAAAGAAFEGCTAVINATSAGLGGGEGLEPPLAATPQEAVVMDMVYKPLVTPLLARAQALGRRTVDGLEMLIGQAIPSFAHFFGRPPPREVDVRALCLKALEQS